MNVGTVYKHKSSLLIQLTEPNLDGYALFLELSFLSSGFWNSGQPLFAKSNGITNQRKANEWVEQNDFVDFSLIKLNPKLEAELQSTYEEPNLIELGVGDKFLEIGKNTEYTVLGFFEREVVKDIADPKSPMVKRRFPYGVNLMPLLNYIGKITNTREGLMSIADQSNAVVVVSDVEQQNLKAIFFANARYPYWSIDAPRVSNVIYLKQPKPLPVIDFQLDFNAVTRGLSPEEYEEYRQLLGEDYDEDFIALVDQMDWGKITELKKQNPNIMQPIRDVIAELYVEFMVQKRLASKQQPPVVTPPVVPPTPPVTPPVTPPPPPAAQGYFEWTLQPWQELGGQAMDLFKSVNGANPNGKIMFCMFEADIPENGTGAIKRENYNWFLFADLGSNAPLRKIYAEMIALEPKWEIDRYLMHTYPEIEAAYNQTNIYTDRVFAIINEKDLKNALNIIAQVPATPPAKPAKPAKPTKPTKPSQPKPVKKKETEILDDILNLDLDDI